ncbi:MAG TPA: UTP--glucose-1-phosphate uridylyltransferase [Fibrobacteria bacterium]|nr:UTP--glucose-1-phosphate uridylyltransferase [Fibrobacteria bacterium]
MMIDPLGERLLRHGQDHLADHLGTLSGAVHDAFRRELESVDWERAASMHRHAGPHVAPLLPEGLAPIPSTEPDASQRDGFWQEGLAMLARGEAAFVLMAGGQGSRLGFDGPKGACPLGLPDDLVLFEVVVRRLLRLGELSGKIPPFAVMTGPENDAATREWFKDRTGPAVPGSRASWPSLFLQSAAPALDDDGKALVSESGKLALVPDGNGGIWERLRDAGILDAWAAAGVKWIHVAGVDNLLSLPCDPVFLGFAKAAGHPLSCKSVLRTDPSEKVGVYVLDGDRHPRVAEYTELPPETAGARAADGLPVFREANIASHLLTLDLARSFAEQELPWHLARKKIPHVDPVSGHDLSDRSGCKYERFLFDAFPSASGMSVLRVSRAGEFAPVKNAQGVDSPQTAREALENLHRSWIAAWGEHRDPPWVDPMESFSGERPTKTSTRS